jgi:hypothetical protein
VCAVIMQLDGGTLTNRSVRGQSGAAAPSLMSPVHCQKFRRQFGRRPNWQSYNWSAVVSPIWVIDLRLFQNLYYSWKLITFLYYLKISLNDNFLYHPSVPPLNWRHEHHGIESFFYLKSTHCFSLLVLKSSLFCF